MRPVALLPKFTAKILLRCGAVRKPASGFDPEKSSLGGQLLTGNSSNAVGSAEASG